MSRSRVQARSARPLIRRSVTMALGLSVAAACPVPAAAPTPESQPVLVGSETREDGLHCKYQLGSRTFERRTKKAACPATAAAPATKDASPPAGAPVAISGAAAARTAAEVRDIGALTPTERLTLADSTKVSFRGNVITLRDVRSFHAQRLKMAAQASAEGAKIAAQLLEQEKAKGKGSKHPPGTLVPMPKSSLKRYAKDYQDFCGSARATACLYLPFVSGYEHVFWLGPGLDEPLSFQVVDPLITDARVCEAGGGGVSAEPLTGCTYYYPAEQTIQFIPVDQMSSVTHCPKKEEHLKGAEWKVTVDPHGAVYQKFQYSGDYGVKGYRYTATCVVQIWGVRHPVS